MHAGAREGKRDRRQALRNQLRRRGIVNPGKVVRAFTPDQIEGALRWYDDELVRWPKLSPGALVNALKDDDEGELAGYGAPQAPANPCPLAGPDRDTLTEAWKHLDARLSKVIGSQWELWLDDAHLHGVGDVFVIACHPAKHSWILERYAPVIARAAVVPVRFVVCQGGGAQ